ncbi:MAG: S8 family serine peptidase, partial [Flavobacteriales bacterium]|nr:S8 family serine peptidase [Flavobacteriales bacterium]
GGRDYVNEVNIAQADVLDNHGTACAGIIGALRNNDLGVSGIAGGDVAQSNTGSQLFSFAVSYAGNYALDGTIADAIVEASIDANGFGDAVHVLNNSYGGPMYTAILSNAVRFAWRNDVVFVASRGNDGTTTLSFPACYSAKRVLNVGASGTDGRKKRNDNGSPVDFYSSYGGAVDFIAPGANELNWTTLDNQIAPYCAATNQDYDCFNGTSASAPHVSGIAALLLSRHRIVNGYQNGLSPEDVERLIEKSATDVNSPPYFNGYDDHNGWGLVNATAAMESIDLPNFEVWHNENQNATTTVTTTEETSWQQIFLGFDNDLAAGTYITDRVRVTKSWNISFDPEVDIIDAWEREGNILGISAANPNEGKEYQNLTINYSGNTATVTGFTFCFFIHSTLGGSIVNQWYPCHPSEANLAFSLHLEHTDATDINEAVVDEGIVVYPNPSLSGIFNLEIQSELAEGISDAYILNSLGQKVQKIETNNISKTTIIDGQLWRKGVYYLVLQTEQSKIVKRIVK